MRVCGFCVQVHIHIIAHKPGLCVQEHMLFIRYLSRESNGRMIAVCFLKENLKAFRTMCPFHVHIVNESEL